MTPATPFFAVMGTCAFLVLGACEQIAGSASLPLTGIAQTPAKHELGREVYNFRCYYCHGYSGDARTLAANFLKPAPRNFKASTVEELPHERVVDAITNGRTGTAMKGFAGTLTPGEISALANFVIEEFVRNKAHNTRYHTDANGWRNHERFSAAFPFATGEIALDESFDVLSAAQRQGRQLFMNTCVTCHDRGRIKVEGPAWAIRPVTYPPDYYLLAESGLADEHSGFDPHHAHEKPPVFARLSSIERRGETIYQSNCAFCHAADGTGRNWVGSFLEPNATDLTSSQSIGKNQVRMTAIISDGVENSSMPAWKHVLSKDDIKAVAAYVSYAFSNPGDRKTQQQ